MFFNNIKHINKIFLKVGKICIFAFRIIYGSGVRQRKLDVYSILKCTKLRCNKDMEHSGICIQIFKPTTDKMY